jgi:hypothetical protein
MPRTFSSEGALHQIAAGVKVHVDRELIVINARAKRLLTTCFLQAYYESFAWKITPWVCCAQQHSMSGGRFTFSLMVYLFILLCVEAVIPLGTHGKKNLCQ